MLREQNGARTHIAHFFTSEAWDEANQRLFRDWLLAHPFDARRYEDVKRLAAEAAAVGRAPYNCGEDGHRAGHG